MEEGTVTFLSLVSQKLTSPTKASNEIRECSIPGWLSKVCSHLQSSHLEEVAAEFHALLSRPV